MFIFDIESECMKTKNLLYESRFSPRLRNYPNKFFNQNLDVTMLIILWRIM